MTKLYYPQISLEDYQIFRKFMLPGEWRLIEAGTATVEHQGHKTAAN